MAAVVLEQDGKAEAEDKMSSELKRLGDEYARKHPQREVKAREEECSNTGFEVLSVAPGFLDHCVSTYREWHRIDPSDSRYLVPEVAALTMNLDLEEARKEILQEETIEKITSILQNRIAFNESTIDLMETQKPEVVGKYLERVYGLRISASSRHYHDAVIEMTEKITRECSSNITAYNKMLLKVKNLKESISLAPFSLEVLYDYMFVNRHALKEWSLVSIFGKGSKRNIKAVEQLGKSKVAYEAIHIERIIKILKPFLSPFYHLFKEKFFKNEQWLDTLNTEVLWCYASEAAEMPNKISLSIANIDVSSLTEHDDVVLVNDCRYLLKEHRNLDHRFNVFLESFRKPLPVGITESTMLLMTLSARKEFFYAYNEQIIKFRNLESKINELLLKLEKQKLEIAAEKRISTVAVVASASVETSPSLVHSTDLVLAERRMREQEILDRKQQREEAEQFRHAQELLNHKRRQAEQNQRYREAVEERRAEKEREKLASEKKEGNEKKEEAELSDSEVVQLVHLSQVVRRHQTVFSAIFGEGDFDCSSFEVFTKALFTGSVLDKPRNLFKFNGSSHFKALIPNTKVFWDKDRGQYKLSRQQMTKIDSWRFHGTDDNEIFTKKGRERCRDGFINAGITPERLKRAEFLHAVRSAAASAATAAATASAPAAATACRR